MCRILVLALTFVYFSSLILTFRQDDYTIKHEYAEIEYYNKNIVKDVTLKNVKPNRTYRAYTIFGTSLVDLGGDTLKGNIKAFKFVNNLFHHKIFDYDVKLCEGLRTNYLGIAAIVRAHNIDARCPFRKGYYKLENFNVVDSQLPPLVPAGRYRIQLTAIYDGYPFLRGSAYGEIIYKIKNN